MNNKNYISNGCSITSGRMYVNTFYHRGRFRDGVKIVDVDSKPLYIINKPTFYIHLDDLFEVSEEQIFELTKLVRDGLCTTIYCTKNICNMEEKHSLKIELDCKLQDAVFVYKRIYSIFGNKCRRKAKFDRYILSKDKNDKDKFVIVSEENMNKKLFYCGR